MGNAVAFENNPTSVKKAVKDLKENNIKSIYIIQRRINQVDSKQLAAAMSENDTLNELLLYYNHLDDISFEYIIDSIQNKINLRIIKIHFNAITYKSVLKLSNNLLHCKSIRELGLFGNSIGPKGAIVLAKALENKNLQIDSINIGRNGIGDEGAIAFADLLFINSTLKYLNLTENLITDEGLTLLEESLHDNKSIEELDLRNNLHISPNKRKQQMNPRLLLTISL